MDLKDIMATNLRRLRQDKQLTQEELAHRSKVSVRYIGAMERGKVSVSVTVLGRVSAALEVAPSDLLAPISRNI